MKKTSHLFSAFTAALAIALLAPAVAAQNLPEADLSEVAAYALTEAGLDKYMQATRNLSGLQIGDCDDDSEVASLADAAAKLDSVPDGRAAVQSAGMTSREYIVFAFSLLQNGLAAHALDQPGGTLPPGVSMANVDFYRKHADEVASLARETEDASCEGDDRGVE